MRASPLNRASLEVISDHYLLTSVSTNLTSCDINVLGRYQNHGSLIQSTSWRESAGQAPGPANSIQEYRKYQRTKTQVIEQIPYQLTGCIPICRERARLSNSYDSKSRYPKMMLSVT